MQKDRVITPIIIIAFVVGALLLMAACGGGGGGKNSASEEPSSASASEEPSSAGRSVAELVATEWSDICTDEKLNSSWADAVQGIEAALAPGGTPTSKDAADLLALLHTATETRHALADAIEAAMASQTEVDCSTGTCTVLVGSDGVLVADFMYGGGEGLGRLDVDEEFSACKEAHVDLATKARALGLKWDCPSLFAGDE